MGNRLQAFGRFDEAHDAYRRAIDGAPPADVPSGYDLGELGRYYRAYDALMAHWRSAPRARVMLKVGDEELLDDFEGNVLRMLAHGGLDGDERCLAFHQTTRQLSTASAAAALPDLGASPAAAQGVAQTAVRRSRSGVGRGRCRLVTLRLIDHEAAPHFIEALRANAARPSNDATRGTRR